MKPHEESGIHMCRQGWKTASRTDATKHDAGVGAVQMVSRQKTAGGSGSTMQRETGRWSPTEKSGMLVQACGRKTDRRTNTTSTAGEGAVQWFPRQKNAGGSGSTMQREAVMSILLTTTNCGRGAVVESSLGKLPVTQWWA